jgi:hypothetical protein
MSLFSFSVDDLDATILKFLRALVIRVGQRPDLMAASQQFIARRPSGVARRPGDQDLAMKHWNSQVNFSKMLTVIELANMGIIVPLQA